MTDSPTVTTIKLWGRSHWLGLFGGSDLHRIEVKPGGYSSWHHHLTYNNLIVVTVGELIVEQATMVDGRLLHSDGRRLSKHDWVCIAPLVWHRFVSPGGGEGFELYWAAGNGQHDIVRFDEGGCSVE